MNNIIHEFYIQEDAPLTIMMRNFCQKYDLPEVYCYFFYQGDLITHSDTAASLEMADGDLIVCRVEFGYVKHHQIFEY
jgi:hypothetical protein